MSEKNLYNHKCFICKRQIKNNKNIFCAFDNIHCSLKCRRITTIIYYKQYYY